MVNIISRAGWRAPTGIPAGRNVPLSSRRWFVVHWPGGTVGSDAAQAVRNIDHFHRTGNRWAVIGYNFLVSRDGRIFEGAGLMTRGIHEPTRNTDGFGVCVMISVGEQPPQAALNATRALYNWLNGRTGRTLSRGFHGQFSATACAGPALNQWVRNGMPATGAPPPPPTIPGVPAFPGRILRQPPIMRGEDVRTWQSRVRARPDLPNIAADGAYGPISEGAARRVQQIAGFPASQQDGRVGPNTWPVTWTTGAGAIGGPAARPGGDRMSSVAFRQTGPPANTEETFRVFRRASDNRVMFSRNAGPYREIGGTNARGAVDIAASPSGWLVISYINMQGRVMELRARVGAVGSNPQWTLSEMGGPA